MTDLDKLIAAVEAGREPSPFDADDGLGKFATARQCNDVTFAYHGSLDAALRLHEALLPEWYYRLGRDGDDFHALVFVSGRMDEHSDDWEMSPDSTARAWLLAILRALAALSAPPEGEKGAG